MLLMLALSVALALAYNALMRLRRMEDSPGGVFLFASIISLVSAVVSLMTSGGITLPALSTAALGIIYGILNAANLYSRIRALQTGPMAATVLIGSSSMLLSTIFGVIFWHESANATQWIGVGAMLIAMTMSIRPTSAQSISGKWIFYVLGLFATNGLSGLVQKLHQSTPAKAEFHTLFLIGYLVSAILSCLVGVTLNRRHNATCAIPRRQFLLAVICGITCCSFCLINTVLIGKMPSVFFFPVFNGSVIVFALPISMLFFKESASKTQIVSMAVAVVAILLMSNVFESVLSLI